jgi:ABC-type lipoprotein export system ATPase subunit
LPAPWLTILPLLLPTGNLDSVTSAAIFNLFEDLVANGKTILMVTHDLDLARRATRTVLLVDGEIADGVGAWDSTIQAANVDETQPEASHA